MALSKVACPLCERRILVAVDQEGGELRCPGCGGKVRVTSSGECIAAARPEQSKLDTRRSSQVQRVVASTEPSHAAPTGPAIPPPLPAAAAVEMPGWLLPAACGAGAIFVIVVLVLFVATPGAQPNRDRDTGVESPVLIQRSDGVGAAAAAASRRRDAAPSVVVAKSEQPSASPASASPESVAKRDGQAGQPEASDDPVRDAIRSVAVVRVPDGHGSGFMVAPDLLVTNYHVISTARMSDVRVGFPDHDGAQGKMFSAELVAEDPVNDVAVLRVKCGVPPLRIEETYKHVNGQKVVAIGSPGTGGPAGDILANLTTDGRLGPAYDIPGGGARWAVAMSINPGNSGGPIIDAATGEVLGVVVAKFKKTEAQSLAVPHATLRSVVRRAQGVTPADLEREATLHRARYCLAHMASLLNVTEFAFKESCKATSEGESDDDKLDIFNDFKGRCARLWSEEFAAFDTSVTAEVNAIRHDTDCDMAVRLALGRLHETIAKQLSGIRASVSGPQVASFLRDYRESLARAMALARTTAKSLAVEIEQEEDQ
jgi:S1-C subfamily serine protease/DNA-directed RNA polymerase subunit RPC12/RpoP